MPRQKQYYGENHLHYLTQSTYRRTRLFDSEKFRQRCCDRIHSKLRNVCATRGYYLKRKRLLDLPPCGV